MGVFKADCPYCGTKSVAFTVVCQRRVEGHDRRDTLAYCGQCDRGIFTSFNPPGGYSPESLLNPDNRHLLDPPKIAPSLPSTDAPRYVPENVRLYYRQAMENLAGSWDAAGSMFRKALEVGLKEKFPEMKGTLFERIVELAEQHKRTSELADWAHQIRIDGNDAAHDEDPFTGEEANRLQAFTRLVFTCLFELPGMLKEAREEAPSVE